MALLKLDHLAVSAETLSAGAEHIRHVLNTELPVGGEHPVMGTHNRLTGMGPELYFEVISVNPDAPAPDFPRWFNLDNFSGPPRLTNWILRTEDMAATLAMLPAGFGTPRKLTRGDLSWQMAGPASGILPWGGWGPAIIEWEGDAHPTQTLPDSGLRLRRLTIHHPDAVEMAELLGPLMPRDTAQFMPDETPKIVAIFDGPDGEKRLE